MKQLYIIIIQILHFLIIIANVVLIIIILLEIMNSKLFPFVILDTQTQKNKCTYFSFLMENSYKLSRKKNQLNYSLSNKISLLLLYNNTCLILPDW